MPLIGIIQASAVIPRSEGPPVVERVFRSPPPFLVLKKLILVKTNVDFGPDAPFDEDARAVGMRMHQRDITLRRERLQGGSEWVDV